jgi:hypothetical protein
MALEIGAARMAGMLLVGRRLPLLMHAGGFVRAVAVLSGEFMSTRAVRSLTRMDDATAKRHHDKQKRHGPDQEPSATRMSQCPSQGRLGRLNALSTAAIGKVVQVSLTSSLRHN